MFQATQFAALVFALSALAVSRAAPPAGWSTGYLENYDTYHTRYLDLDCHSKHNTKFFDQCCHPLLAIEQLSVRPAHCDPGSSAVPVPQPAFDDDNEDCEDSDSYKEVDAPTPASENLAATPEASAPNTSSQLAKSSSASSTAATVYTGGYATFYYQDGVAGACGKVHTDSEMIGAIDGDRYGNLGTISSQCNKQVKITNSNNGKTVTITIADACPTCRNSNSIDLSEAAFKKIASLDDGIVPISWSYV